jgi:hypothetical protein
MASLKKTPWEAYAIGGGLLLYLVNYGLVQMGFAPVLWCALRHTGAALQGWYQVATLLALVWFVVVVVKQGIGGALWAMWPVVLIFGLPVFAESLIGLGASDRCS